MLPLSLPRHVETGRAHQKRISAPATITANIPIANLAKSSSITYSSFGGPGENRTPVHNAFTTKELQQFFNYLLRRRTLRTAALVLVFARYDILFSLLNNTI